MSDPPEHDGPPGRDRAADRHSATSARHHVGAAGFAQSQALEEIISAGREQIALAQSLRQVVATTQTQLRDIALRYDAEVAQVHVATLQGVVSSGRAQIEAAETLREAIQNALTDVRGTPLEDISAGVLVTLGRAVQRQAQALDELLAVAISEARSAEQLTKLERVSADVALRFEAAEHERTERELVYLEHLRNQAVQRIRELEEEGRSHAAQKAQLEEDAGHSQRRIDVLEAAEVRDRAQIEVLEAQDRESVARLATLEEAAVENRERLKELEARPAEPGQKTRDDT